MNYEIIPGWIVASKSLKNAFGMISELLPNELQ